MLITPSSNMTLICVSCGKLDLVEMTCKDIKSNIPFLWKKLSNNWPIEAGIHAYLFEICNIYQNFVHSIQSQFIFLHCYDTLVLFPQPLPETVALVEDIVVEYVTDFVSTLKQKLFAISHLFQRGICSYIVILMYLIHFHQAHKAQEIGSKRGKLSVEDFLYLVRKVSGTALPAPFSSCLALVFHFHFLCFMEELLKLIWFWRCIPLLVCQITVAPSNSSFFLLQFEICSLHSSYMYLRNR